jgi:hypothetical protein
MNDVIGAASPRYGKWQGIPKREQYGFCPGRQADSSPARSAWVAMQRGTVQGGTVEVMVRPNLRSVQSSRWDEAIFLMIPGTSCLATIVLSLRDKNHSQTQSTAC